MIFIKLIFTLEKYLKMENKFPLLIPLLKKNQILLTYLEKIDNFKFSRAIMHIS